MKKEQTHGQRPERRDREAYERSLATIAAEAPAMGFAGHGYPVLRDFDAQVRGLVEAPPRIELWFNERLEPAYSKASVTNEAGEQVDRRDVAVSAEDPRRLSLSLPALKPGRYTVSFRVLSVDGHVVESRLSFTVKDRR